MAGNMKEAFLSAPPDMMDREIREIIERWDDDTKSIQVLETIDMAIHHSSASGLTVSLLQKYYGTLLQKEGKTHEDNVPLATWRNK